MIRGSPTSGRWARAVYLGNRWILTVAHLSTAGGTAVFGGTSYGFVDGTNTRLSNPPEPGPSGVVDLRMIRLDSDPGLPSVTIGSAAPTSGRDLVMIGRGLNRQAGDFHWDVDTAPDPDVWTEVLPPPPPDASGHKTAGVKTMRWGENEIDNPAVVINAGFGDTQSFTTMFDSVGMTHEAQAVSGDSGGGVFAKDGANWELVGIMHTVSAYNGQPANAVVFGTETNSADLSRYRNGILALVATPEPNSLLLGLSGLCLLLRRRRE